MDLSVGEIDIDSIMEEVNNKSFEAIDVADIDSYNEAATVPANKGKNMQTLQRWYEDTVASEWNQFHAQNADAGSETDSQNSSDEDAESFLTLGTEMCWGDSEEIYCLCRRHDVKEAMVACDGSKCRFIWFHFSCVGLPPNWSSDEDWFCPECR